MKWRRRQCFNCSAYLETVEIPTTLLPEFDHAADFVYAAEEPTSEQIEVLQRQAAQAPVAFGLTEWAQFSDLRRGVQFSTSLRGKLVNGALWQLRNCDSEST